MNTTIHQLRCYYLKLKELGLVTDSSITAEQMADRIQYISFNSEDIKNNTLFACKGSHFLPEYLFSAIRCGAAAYVSEQEYELPEDIADTPRIIVSDIRLAMAVIAEIFYDDICSRINMIGITGTKGKSSTTFFVKSIIDEYMRNSGGRESAVISGITNYDGVIDSESRLTTPETFELYEHICNAVSSGIDYLTMEVSSQGLKYHRVHGITYDVGCFLNIGNDHISSVEHNSREDYLMSKLKLFSQCRTICINLDSDMIDRIMQSAVSVQQYHQENNSPVPDIVTFSCEKPADYHAYDIKANSADHAGITFSIKAPDFDEKFEITMRGLFNVENALAAVSITRCLGIPVPFIKDGLKKAHISGRMEVFTSKKRGLNVIVDYAHNQMSFEKLFQSVKKEFPGRRISIVFGCPGGKAQNRRHELGTIAGKYADKVYLTEDDPGEESVLDICNEIADYVRPFNCPFEIIENRGDAIRRAITSAPAGTVVIAAGKGRETRHKRGLEYISTPSDVDYVQEILKFEY